MARQTKEKKKELRQKRSPLKRAVLALHEARLELAEAKGNLELKQLEFERKNKELITRVESADLAVRLNDETLRNLLLEKHAEMQETAFGPGLDIKLRDTVVIDNQDALTLWCSKNAPYLFKLSEADAILAVKLLSVWIPKDYAHIEAQPIAYIAKDLAKAVEALEQARRAS